jgi:hypothetical protein
MNRKAVVIAGGVLFVAVVAFVLASASKGHSDLTPRNGWMVKFTMPASNTPAVLQTNNQTAKK